MSTQEQDLILDILSSIVSAVGYFEANADPGYCGRTDVDDARDLVEQLRLLWSARSANADQSKPFTTAERSGNK